MQQCNRSQKIAICMVGLPARGKTYMSRKLNRYLSWLGYRSRVFNIGHYRRQLCGTECDFSFFDSRNEEAVNARNMCAITALNDMCEFLRGDGEIGLLDGTNTTKERRKLIQNQLHKQFEGIQILWIESICDRKDIINNNIVITKLNNPDYVGKDSEEATQDFLQRISKYEEIYEHISNEEELSYLKIINICENIVIHQVKGYLQSKIIAYVLNLHIYPRPVYLSRHGQSQFNQADKVGGDSDLSALGEQYANKLSDYLLLEFPTKQQRNEIFCMTSTMRRAIHTTEVVTNKLDIKYVSLKTLDEINVGICDGLTYEEIAQQFPSDFQERKINKLTYRYPRGESYLDLISRIEPIIFEIERSREPVLVIAHQAVLRCLYAYFHQNLIPEVPSLEIPLHCIIKLTPGAYYCEETRIKIDPITGEQSIICQEHNNQKNKSYIDL